MKRHILWSLAIILPAFGMAQNQDMDKTHQYRIIATIAFPVLLLGLLFLYYLFTNKRKKKV